MVDGAVVSELDRDELAELRGRIGYVFQFAALFDSMTVAENIALGLVRRGHDPGDDRARGSRRAWRWWSCAAPRTSTRPS